VPKLSSAMAASSSSLMHALARRGGCTSAPQFAFRSGSTVAGSVRRLPVAAVGMVATMAMVGGPKLPMRTSGREPSTAVASLGQARAAAGTASESGKDEEPQTVVTPQWLYDRLESDTTIKVSASSILPLFGTIHY
jgi:hypothetical protein